MKNKWRQSLELYYSLAVVIFISLCFFNSETIDVAIHDTYFVIPTWFINLLIALLFFLFAVVSWIMRRIQKPLNKTMTFIHLILTFVACLTISLSLNKVIEQPTKYLDSTVQSELENSMTSVANFYISLSLLLIILATGLYIFNVVKSLFYKPI
jgi:heme/copper-type cytochrome/quinol oxidase subunit 1